MFRDKTKKLRKARLREQAKNPLREIPARTWPVYSPLLDPRK